MPSNVAEFDQERVVNSDDVTRPLCEELRLALQETGTPQKVAAIETCTDPGLFSRYLSGERNFPLNQLERLPKRAQRVFIRRWAMRLGMTFIPTSDQRGELVLHWAFRELSKLYGGDE